MVDEINAQIDHLCTLKFTDEELDYLASLRFIKSDYVEFLRLWHPIRKYVNCWTNEFSGELFIEVAGPLFSAMQFEIYLLEIVNEVYFRMQYDYLELLDSAKDRLADKIQGLQDKYTFKFAEFGCRRRLSREWQDYVVRELLKTGKCVGTSNVYLAMKYGCKPIGTYAHEYVQMYQGVPGVTLAYTNKMAMQEWFEEYQGDNGTALTDTLGTDLFLMDFDKLQAMCYTGVRHYSGDPIVWGEKIIAHYEKLGINPKTKTLLFSDSLDFDKAQEIYDHFKDRINVSFGIGTYLSNDTAVDPLNIVIKLQYVNGHPVAKLSDVPGKTMCQDDSYIDYLKNAVDYRIKEGI
jgi:nicotinate phosphoribosyltransferase